MFKNPKGRFSDRVENYIKCRPGYPPAVLDALKREAGLTRDSVVADIGSGTGISSRLFLKNGNTVFAVEPNAEMRQAAEQASAADPKFHSVAGSAEATGLPDRSVDLICCAQAFHWLDPLAAAEEFRRILRPGGAIAVIWNERSRSASPFLDAYDKLLLKYGTDYKEVSARHTMAEDFGRLFAMPFRRLAFENFQTFDLEGLRGRLLSSSYVPAAGAPGHEELFAEVQKLFERSRRDGVVRIEYETEMFLGRFASD